MNAPALTAIVRARLESQRFPLAMGCTAAFAVGFTQSGDAYAGFLFCSLLGVAMALLQIPGRCVRLDLCERGAPLFGRELARAKALAACGSGALCTLAAFAGALATTDAPGLRWLLATLASVACATLVALSATMRTGWQRTLYVALAIAAAIVACALALVAHALAAELAFSAAVAVLALRQYGETLARYDPA